MRTEDAENARQACHSSKWTGSVLSPRAGVGAEAGETAVHWAEKTAYGKL